MEQAAENGHEAVLQVFLEKGVSPNRPDDRSRDPLQLAVQRGHVGMARTLLAHGAETWMNDAAVFCDAF